MEIQGYRLHEVVGDGRTGRVFRAERISDDTQVAFRQLRPVLAQEQGVAEKVLELTRVCSDLKCVAVVPVIDVFELEGAICVVEPWVDGRTLKDRCAEGTLPPDEVATLGVELLEGLAELHDAGLIHGDISPANIMLTSRGGRMLNPGIAARTARRRHAKSMFGDPFDAPEVQSTGTVSRSSDLYGLAASLDLALQGERDNTAFALQSDDPDPLVTVLREGMASHPNMRFKDAGEFRKALLRVLRDGPPLEAKRSPRQERREQGARERPASTSISTERSMPAPPRELPPWAPKAALFGGIALAVILLVGWLVSLLPDVPPGMVEVPESSASMGDPEGTRDERPGFGWGHDRFFLDLAEVTVGEYGACVRAGGCTPVGTRLARLQEDPSEAVAGVTWLQASAWCAQQDKRLPSENEWEAAARHFGGRYPWGDGAPTCARAWYGGLASGPCSRPGIDPAPRGVDPEVLAAASGPVNLAGNLWEYTNSDYEPHRRPGSGELAPAGSSVLKVIKGGAFSAGRSELRSAARLGVEMDHWAGDVGFRCAKAPDE